jgi:hypothetical protein
MARTSGIAPHRSRRLLLAAAMIFVAMTLLFLVLGGHVYSMTQGATIGLYLTVIMLCAGLTFAAAGCVLSLQVVFGRRRLDNIVELHRSGKRRRGRAA